MELQEIKDIKTLYLVKQDWLNGEYVLTDGNDNYGTLMYDGFSRQSGMAAIAGTTWTFETDKPLFWGNQTIFIKDSNNVQIGITKNIETTPCLVMNNGFTATFFNVSLFGNEYEWRLNKSGTIIRFKSPFFSLTDTITIFKDIPDGTLLLLCFLAEHILILRKRRRTS